MPVARGLGARILVLTAAVVGTMAAGVRAAESDRVLEAGVLTYAAFDASEVQIARRPRRRCWPPPESKSPGGDARATAAVKNRRPAGPSSGCTCCP